MFSLTKTTLVTCDMQWCVPRDPPGPFFISHGAPKLNCRIIMVDVTAVFDEFVHHHHVVIGHSNTLKKMF